MSVLRIAVFSLMVATPLGAETFQSAFPEVHGQVDDQTRALLDRIEVEHGTVTLGGGIATITLPDGYYFIGQAGAKVVLEDLWGNPPAPAPLGMIFPRDYSPLHDTWGATVEFDPMGYVSDEDAAETDYQALMKDMQADARAANEERAKAGYPRVTVVGWAEPPHYDATTRELYWAKELQFEGDDTNTVNYNIRELGRKGVMVINFIATMPQPPDVRAAAPDVLRMVDFTEGNRYADFIPGTDTVAAVGLGGLIAGKVLAKAGLLAMALALLKKGGFLILLPVVWLVNRLRGRGNA